VAGVTGASPALPAGEPVERRGVDGALIEIVPRPPLAAALRLEPHPEGGWYRRTWTSSVPVTGPGGRGAERTRPTATLILFLLPVGEVSAWHRVASDEVWIANGPAPLDLQLGGSGEHPVEGEVLGLGDVVEGRLAQAVVPAGVWQRTLPAPEDVLVSCLVSPGFDFADFELDTPSG
jgi:uncharacterized protein